MSPKIEVAIAIADQLQKGLSRAESRLKQFAQSSKSMLSVGATGLAGGTAVALLAKQAIEYGTQIEDMANKTGLTIDAIQKLDFVAKQSGTSVEGLRKAIMEGSKSAFENSAAYQKLGIVFKNENGNLLEAEKIFENTVRVLSGVKNKTEQAAVAQKLFGKSAGEVLSVVSQGQPEIDAMFNKLQRGGLILTNQTVKALDACGDKIAEMNQRWKVMAAQLSVAVLPVIDRLAPKFEKLAEDIGLVLNAGSQEGKRQTFENQAIALKNLNAEIERLNASFEQQDKLRGSARNTSYMSALHDRIILANQEKNALINEIRGGNNGLPSPAASGFDPDTFSTGKSKAKEALQSLRDELARVNTEIATSNLKAIDDEHQGRAELMMSQLADSQRLQEELTRIKAEGAEFRKRIDADEYDRIQDSVKSQMVLFSELGAAIGGSISSGSSGIRQALKGVLITILSFVEKEMLAATFAGAAQSLITWNPAPLAKALGIAGAFEAAKAGISNFRMGTQYAPGGVTQLHRDEVLSIPSGTRVYNSSEVRQRSSGGAASIQIVQNLNGTVDSDILERSNSALLRDLERMSRRGLINGISFAR